MKPSIAPSELVENLDFYPRKDINNHHVNVLVDALRAGATLPPVVADKKTRVIVDGVLRRRAHIKVNRDAPIAVEWVNCATEADMYREAIRRNAAHGLRFEHDDEIRCVLLADRYGITTLEVSVLMSKPAAVIETLRHNTVFVGGVPEPVKHLAIHLAGTEVTEEQAEAIRQSPGAPLLQIVNQLHKIVDAGIYDATNLRHLAALHGLAQLIIKRVPNPVPAVPAMEALVAAPIAKKTSGATKKAAAK